MPIRTRHARPLSVVVTTRDPWPKLRDFVERVEEPLRAVAGELVVCDGHGSGLPADGWPYAVTHVAVVHPGASVFDLRAYGVTAASGDIVALSEDHCVPEPEWCAELIAAHRAHPNADAVGGAVLNGSTSALLDWANFLATFAEFLPPLPPVPRARVPPAANVSFKRSVLPGERPAAGWIELELVPRLHLEGRIALSDRPRVVHVQSRGLIGTPVVHFHNGRSTTGLRVRRLSPAALLEEVGRHLWRPFQLAWQTYAAVRAHTGLPRRATLCLPAALGLSVCHSAGEVIGLLTGPGRSPQRLE